MKKFQNCNFSYSITEKSKSPEENNPNVQGIGQRVTRRTKIEPPKLIEEDKCVIKEFGLKITGIAFSFGSSGLDSYFLALSDIKSQSTNDDTIAPHTQDETITLQEKVNFVKLLLKRPKRKVIIFDAKMALKFLMLGLQIQVQNCFVFDPKIATWMLKPGEAQPHPFCPLRDFERS